MPRTPIRFHGPQHQLTQYVVARRFLVEDVNCPASRVFAEWRRRIIHAMTVPAQLLFLPLPPPSPASSAVLIMVLTRRAHKCIVRWFPNEVLSEILLYLPPIDLLALCRTSRLISGLATPLLYRCIDLCDIPQMETFVSALEKHAESPVPLWCHIQQFSINMLDGLYVPLSRATVCNPEQ
jgi:hypothetical protein